MKNLSLVLVLAAFAILGTAYQRNPVPTDENTRVVEALFEAFNAHDWDTMVSLYASDAVLEDPSYETVVVGSEGMKQKYAGLEEIFPDIRDEVRYIYTSGEHVIVEFVSRGTGADSIPFKLNLCSVITVRQGKIIRDATYYDL